VIQANLAPHERKGNERQFQLKSLSRAILPFLLASIAVLLVCTYWTGLIMLIPQWFGYVAR
jgi:TRAP-type C4-dicarboxylate transport system permease large subunit